MSATFQPGRGLRAGARPHRKQPKNPRPLSEERMIEQAMMVIEVQARTEVAVPVSELGPKGRRGDLRVLTEVARRALGLPRHMEVEAYKARIPGTDWVLEA